jgi:uncharacterized membrane protein YccC
MSTQRILGTVFGAILFAVALSFLLSWPVMVLWNECLVPAVQGINEITWLQSWGLSVLSGFLFNRTTTVKE